MPAVLWTLVLPEAAFAYLAAWTLLALSGLVAAGQSDRSDKLGPLPRGRWRPLDRVPDATQRERSVAARAVVAVDEARRGATKAVVVSVTRPVAEVDSPMSAEQGLDAVAALFDGAGAEVEVRQLPACPDRAGDILAVININAAKCHHACATWPASSQAP
jgi:hypothetical protein